MRRLKIRGASEHNLRDIDLDLELGRWIDVTGPSGSGKTSLVFGTLVAESQRRYLSTLSARARHYLAKLERPRVDRLEGLPVAIAVGQATATANVRSTVGTLTGVLDLLRLLFARDAVDPEGESLSRSHFSFNHPLGACPACGGLGVTDRVDPALLVSDPSKSIRDGALVPTLANGYTVYSQVTLEVMNQICEAHGFTVHTPWNQLTEEQQRVVLYGTTALEVPFGKHSLESRMRWKGITARPRQVGYYKGLVPVIEETLERSRNPGVLRFVRSSPCPECGGSRLSRPGREAQLDAFTLPTLLSFTVAGLEVPLSSLPQTPVWKALHPSIEARLTRLRRLSLGHLSLDRVSTTLSDGEAQRVRLAAQLTAGLSGMLVCLDEPTLGLHPEAGPQMAEVLDELVEGGNTLVVVEHDPDMVRYCDHRIDIGPGAGPDGGRVSYDGPPEPDPLGPPPRPKQPRRPGRGELTLRGATLHNLDRADLTVRWGAFNVVIGPSGAGKSSLVFQTLLPALCGQPGGPYAKLEGRSTHDIRALDARPLGKTSRSTPATFSGLFDLVRARFAATPHAKQLGFRAGRFSYNNKEGRCPTCEGLGVQRIGLHLVADARITCPSCNGLRYEPDTLKVRLRGASIADILAMSVCEFRTFFAEDEPLAALAGAMDDLGLGYLELGQPSASLSRGEAQRLKLATLLGKASEPTLLLLDEPDRGLHPTDVERLLRGLDRLIDAGHTVLAISHHRQVWAAADFLTEVRDGTAREIEKPSLQRTGARRTVRPAPSERPHLELRGVTHHNLTGVELRIPHDTFTVVAGVSGSGKSSLVFDALVGEAWHRFAESLPFSVRRFVQRLPRASIESATGLRPAIALAQGQARAPRRSTLSTQSELGPLLRTLWSRAGLLEGRPCRLTAEHFSPDRPLGACPTCEGLGVVARCDPELLVTDPGRSLSEGALRGTRPGKFFTEPEGQHLATLQAAVGDVDLDRPWSELPAEVREVALHGAGERILSVRWTFKRGTRTGEHHFEGTWDGLCTLVEREARRRASSKHAEQWAVPLRDRACADCEGARIGPLPAAVNLGRWTLPELMRLPLSEVGPALESLSVQDAERAAALEALRPEILERVFELCELGLGHLALERASASLSEGELQRVRLAGVLRSSLTASMVVLDEPAQGLHPHQVARLVERLEHLRDAGNTVVVVTHRTELIRAADHLIELGPGAGEAGGTIVDQGPPSRVLAGDGPTAMALRNTARLAKRHPSPERIVIEGAHAHNLAHIDVELPSSGFVAVTGLSGSGKSSLVFDVLGASVSAGRAIGCATIEGASRFGDVLSARGRTTNATVLHALGLMPALQKLFASAAKGTSLPRQAFSFASPAGRCETCKGSGTQEVSMDILADLSLPCPACEGRRYRPEVLEVRWQGLDVAEFLDTPVDALASSVTGDLANGMQSMISVGLGHLALGRASRELSGGEAQRLGLAASLSQKPKSKARATLVLLDEPATGLHESDLARLIEVFHRLAERGDLVVATEHRVSMVRAADWVVDLGPGGGPSGGRLVAQGPPRDLTTGLTATYLRAES